MNELGQPYTPPRPSRDYTGKVAWKVLFDFTSNRHRWEVEEDGFLYNQEQFTPVVRLNVCDGRVAQNSRPRPPGAEKDDAPPDYSNLDMSTIRGNLSHVVFEGGSLPLFHGHGIVPTTEDRLYAGHLRREVNPDFFYVHGTGVHGGRPCLVLRTEPIGTGRSFHEFWVDEARQAAIVRYAYFSSGEVTENYDVRYQDSRDGWMPVSWTYMVFNRGKTHTIRKFHVEAREVAVPVRAQDFRLEVQPWMRIRQVEFEKSPNPLVMPRPVADTMQVAGAGLGGLGGGGGAWWWALLLGVAAALAAAAGAGWWLLRARKAGLGWRGRTPGGSG